MVTEKCAFVTDLDRVSHSAFITGAALPRHSLIKFSSSRSPQYVEQNLDAIGLPFVSVDLSRANHKSTRLCSPDDRGFRIDGRRWTGRFRRASFSECGD